MKPRFGEHQNCTAKTGNSVEVFVGFIKTCGNHTKSLEGSVKMGVEKKKKNSFYESEVVVEKEKQEMMKKPVQK